MIFWEASGDKSTGKLPMVILDKSACLAGLPGPYYFRLRTAEETTDAILGFGYLGDIIFYPTGAGGDTLRYSNEKLGISFSPLKPNIFYLCPDTGSDTGRLFAIMAARDFANKNPFLAKKARDRLLKNPRILYEGDAIGYLEAAVEESATGKNEDSATKNALTDIVLMFNEKSAGLEFLIDDIARVNTNDLRLKKSGVPFDVSASNLFLTHSAFPSL